MDESDAASAYGATWYATTKVNAPARPPLTVDLDVDVCVIGGGLAGLTTAREVARGGWSVVLLEAGRIAASASGRNTGFVLPGFAAAPESIVARVGLARARDLWALSQNGVDYVRTAIADEAMPGVDARDGWLRVCKNNNSDASMRQVDLLGKLDAEVESWPAERVCTVLRSQRYHHAIYFPRAFHIHPLNYALGLAAAAERAGARICEHTPALSIDPAGVRKRIVTPNARLRANHVVLCGNTEIATLMRPVAAALIPMTTYLITTAPLGSALAEAVDFHGAVSDTVFVDNHYRIVDGDRLMWSGRLTAWARNPRRYRRALTADIQKIYPQLGEVAVDYVWSGTLGSSIHHMPQIGELGPGLWLASGFGGHGLNTTAMAGNLIARAIIDGDQAWRQFTPFELVWAGGLCGRAVAQVYYWSKRLQDKLAERAAPNVTHESVPESAIVANAAAPLAPPVTETAAAAEPEPLPSEPIGWNEPGPREAPFSEVQSGAEDARPPEPSAASKRPRQRKGAKQPGGKG